MTMEELEHVAVPECLAAAAAGSSGSGSGASTCDVLLHTAASETS